MPTTQTILYPPPVRQSNVDPQMIKWFLVLQALIPLRLVDTSNGAYAENAPPAGLNSSTGQSSQNQEITYVKSSADTNVFTLNGVQGGPYALTNQYDALKIKSDGTNWWLATRLGSGSIWKTVKVSADYSPVNGEAVMVDSSGGDVNITLPPTASNLNSLIDVKKISSDFNNVNVIGSGADVIDGSGTQTVIPQYTSLTMLSDGAGHWDVI